MGTHVPCGGAYVTEFSCPSQGESPLVPLYKVSFDGIVYFSDDGLINVGADLMHDYRKRSHGSSLVDHLLISFDELRHELDTGKQELEFVKSELESGKQECKQELDLVKSELESGFSVQGELLGKLEGGLQSLRKAVPLQGAGVLLDIFMSVGAVLICAAVVFAVQRNR